MPKKQKTPAKKEETEVRIVINQAQEYGTSGLKQQSGFIYEAYNSALFYPNAYAVYNKIWRAMPEMAMIRLAFTTWARSVSPTVDLPDKPTDDDKRYQEFIEQDFGNMEGGFTTLIDTMVNYIPFFGFGWWDVAPAIREPEWVPPPYQDKDGKPWKDEWRSEYDDGLIGLRRIGWRDLSTFAGWEFDGRKKVIGMKQQDYPNPIITLDKNHSLHMTFGNPNNPEGITPLESIWRLERIKYGLEVIMGIGFEHSAGFLNAKKTEKGTLTTKDEQNVKAAARAILTAQEGNYALWPFGVEGEVMDIPFQAAGNLLEAIKYYGILALSVYMMQFIALNTMTNTGALASQVDSTQMGIFSFNAMLDGFAAQYDEQIGKRLYQWNKNSFPNLTKRPTIRFSHMDNNLAMGELGNFLRSIQGIVPLGEDDMKAFRKRTGWMPENNPKPEDVIETKTEPAPPPQNDELPMPDDATVKRASATSEMIREALFVNSRARRE